MFRDTELGHRMQCHTAVLDKAGAQVLRLNVFVLLDFQRIRCNCLIAGRINTPRKCTLHPQF